MKFSEFPYERPDYPKLMETISQLTERFKKAESASEQIAILKELEQLRIELTTNVQIWHHPLHCGHPRPILQSGGGVQRADGSGARRKAPGV